MSRTTVSTKTGRRLVFPADSSCDPEILGDMLHAKGVTCMKCGTVGNPIYYLPYDGTPEYCRLVADTLAELTAQDVAEHFVRMRDSYAPECTVRDVTKWLRYCAGYFRRLKGGFRALD